ncbi:MAG: CPBP family intramembrane glutamic endopeptidase [Akkermansiaceae bacterium]|jgi:membrane protease YdiL (CAAX protease family)
MTESPYHPPNNPEVTPPQLPPPLPALPNTPWNGWWTLLWAVVIFFVWQLVVSIGLIIAAFQRNFFNDVSDADSIESDLLALAFDGDVAGSVTFISIFLVCPLCWMIGKIRTGYTGWEYLGNDKVKWWHWPFWAAITVACSIIFGLIAPSLGIDGPDDSMVTMARTTQFPILLYLGVGIGAPFVEEFMFRGALWRGWRASKLGLWGTLGLTSFLWAILHVQYPFVIIAYIFCLGLILGLAREKTGNLWIPVWMHAVNNGIATFEMLRL